jgi:xanthine dehydrogenase accessory factor
MKRRFIQAVLEARQAGHSIALVTDLDSGQQTLVSPTDEGDLIQRGDAGLDQGGLPLIAAALRDDRSGIVQHGETSWFVHVFNPPLRLLLVGAVHIAQPLAQMAALAGYALTIIDPRSAFATEDRFPGMRLMSEWPDEAVAQLAPDARTAVVTLTHDPKLDDPALATALGTPAFYIGALGSRKTHAKRLERLREQGLGEAALARIRGPVGLDIGAVSPAEIAISILADLTMALHGGPKGASRPKAD